MRLLKITFTSFQIFNVFVPANYWIASGASSSLKIIEKRGFVLRGQKQNRLGNIGLRGC